MIYDKINDFEAITSVIKETLENNFLKMAEAEKNVFISWECLEILINKNVQMAINFITPYINGKDNYETNAPIINISYFICLLLNDKNTTFDKFKEFVMLYKPIIEEKDVTLKNI